VTAALDLQVRSLGAGVPVLTWALAGTPAEEPLPLGIRHELDLWGYDVPHDWPSWRAQLAHHTPRFC
jgi:hypothetical protein